MLALDKPVWRMAVEAFLLAAVTGIAVTGYLWILQKGGVASSDLYLSLVGTAVALLSLPLFYLLIKQRAIIARVQKEREEERLRDETTRLYKGKVFKELASAQIRMCKRRNWPVGMVVLDVDRLSGINEKYGYEVGNEVLKRFAAVFRETLRQSDLVSRYDDDRFLILLPDCDAKSAKKVMQRIQETLLSQPLEVDGVSVKVPFSSGVVSLAGKVAKFHHLVNRATEAMDRAKRRGGNRIEVY